MTAKTVAILQSNYVPWRGYFDLIRSVDEFIVYDDRQYTKNDWRNRNRIKTPQGVRWLTIPVRSHLGQRIDEVEAADPRWAERHWQTLVGSYRRAPCFDECRDALETLYLGHDDRSLSAINRRFIDGLCSLLGIRTRITCSRDYVANGRGGERVLSICHAAGASTYLSGPAARSYLDEAMFARAGVAVRWMDYEGYPAYPQLHGDYDPAVSVLDLLFQTGAEARRYLDRAAR